MSDDVRVVVSKDEDDNEVKVAVLKPKAKHLREAQLSYNRAFRDALESGALLRQKLEDHMREQGIWDDTKQERYDEINKTFVEPYLPNNKIGIMHLAAGLWKNNIDMRIDKNVTIDIETLDGNIISKSLRFD